MDRWTGDGWVDRQVNRMDVQMSRRRDGWMGEWMDAAEGQVHEWWLPSEFPPWGLRFWGSLNLIIL